MAWNSVGLEVLYQVLGWVAFFAWSFSFYPQVLLNYRRKRSVAPSRPCFSVVCAVPWDDQIEFAVRVP